MTNIDIQKSRHLLKRLERDMNFLLDILDQTKSYVDQARYIASDLGITQEEIRYILRKKSDTERS
jgi:hypothetical protein